MNTGGSDRPNEDTQGKQEVRGGRGRGRIVTARLTEGREKDRLRRFPTAPPGFIRKSFLLRPGRSSAAAFRGKL